MKWKKSVAPSAIDHAADIAIGAGELAGTLPGALRTSASTPLLKALLASLFTCSFSLFSLVLLSAEAAADPSAVDSSNSLGGAVQRGTSQTMPVKLLRTKPPFAHLRHGLPDRSRARSPALIAPWFALGPSLCPAAPDRAFGSIVPSSL